MVPIAGLRPGFLGATESVSTHLPVSRLQIVVAFSAVLPIFGGFCLSNVHLL